MTRRPTRAIPVLHPGPDEIEPEWVLLWIAPAFLARLRDRLTCPGIWEFQTAESHFAGDPPLCSLEGPRGKPGSELAEWIRSILGFPVRLDPDDFMMRVEGRLGQPRGPWHTLPFYWVRRNT